MRRHRERIPDSGVSPHEPAEEARLLERIRQGDAEAFDTICRREAPRLYRFALRLTGDVETAEELAQETLVKTLPKLGGFEGRSRLSTYLAGALSNLWKNRLRSKARSKVVDIARPDDATDPLERFSDAAPDPERALDATDRAGAIREAVGRLEPERRLALLLCEVEGMSYEAIAETTGVPIGTVRSRIARARGELRRLLAELWP